MSSIPRQELWDFFRATFHRAVYYLASATLTNSAVKDIQSKAILTPGKHCSFNKYRYLIGSLCILREDLVILFKSPTRSNIFLQVNLIHISISRHCFQVREHDVLQDDTVRLKSLLSFIVPVLADSSRKSIQVFFQKKCLLNVVGGLLNHKFYFILTAKGTFIKSTAEELNLDHFGWNTVMVMSNFENTQTLIEITLSETNWRHRKGPQSQSGSAVQGWVRQNVRYSSITFHALEGR